MRFSSARGPRVVGDPTTSNLDDAGGDGFGPVEFVRNESGQIGWVRVNGRIARKV